jgi:antitoxin component HigA of HigAB toxin-antitoxin module
MEARLAELSDNELSCLLEEKTAETHKKATKTAVKVFRQYLEARQINQDDLVGSKETLANALRKFYAEARKRDGELI